MTDDDLIPGRWIQNKPTGRVYLVMGPLNDGQILIRRQNPRTGEQGEPTPRSRLWLDWWFEPYAHPVWLPDYHLRSSFSSHLLSA